MSDTHDDIKEAMCAAAPELRPEVKEGVVQRMSAVQPRSRRHTVAWIVAAVAATPLLLGAAVATGVLPWPIEGKLYYRSAGDFGPGRSGGGIFQALTGQSQVEDAMPASDSDPSPVDDRIVWATNYFPELHPTERDVVIGTADGEEQINLTQTAGIGGLNCKPKWSPDGTMIAFQHCDAVGDKPPCKDGFHVWVMNDDGSGARPLLPDSAPPTVSPVWFPDGNRLLVNTEGSEGNEEVSVDLSGQSIYPMPDVGGDAAWSPDETTIASTTVVKGELDGEAGYWRQLVLTDANGEDLRVLVKQFLVDSEVEARYPTEEQVAKDPEMDWLADLRFWVGPTTPQWSPRGDKIAFLAALPFDAEGPYYREQVEVWIYDLETSELTRVTEDNVGQYSLIWKKP